MADTLTPNTAASPANGREAFEMAYVSAACAMPYDTYMDDELRQTWFEEWATAEEDPECVARHEATIKANIESNRRN